MSDGGNTKKLVIYVSYCRQASWLQTVHCVYTVLVYSAPISLAGLGREGHGEKGKGIRERLKKGNEKGQGKGMTGKGRRIGDGREERRRDTFPPNLRYLAMPL